MADFDKARLNLVAPLVLMELKHWQGSIADCVREYAAEYNLSPYDLIKAVDALIDKGGSDD